ncbi:hypothetical protein pb186bvf_010273 [Paramecium bursaria]
MNQEDDDFNIRERKNMSFYLPLLLVCCKVGIIIAFFTIMTVWGLNIYMKYKSPLNLDCNMVYDSEEHIYEEDKKILIIHFATNDIQLDFKDMNAQYNKIQFYDDEYLSLDQKSCNFTALFNSIFHTLSKDSKVKQFERVVVLCDQKSYNISQTFVRIAKASSKQNYLKFPILNRIKNANYTLVNIGEAPYEDSKSSKSDDLYQIVNLRQSHLKDAIVLEIEDNAFKEILDSILNQYYK